MAEKLDLDECEAIAKVAYLPQDMTLQLIARIRELESRATEAEATGKRVVGVPKEWKLVPVEATDEMLVSLARGVCVFDGVLDESYKVHVRRWWATLLATSPSATVDVAASGEAKRTALCKGSMALGSGCGRCERCVEEIEAAEPGSFVRNAGKWLSIAAPTPTAPDDVVLDA